MPISNTVLTKEQFEYLAQNITDQTTEVATSAALALSGLHYVVLLQVDAPEVDLINPFADQVQRMDGLDVDNNWVTVVTAMNTHAVNRGTEDTGTLSDRLNSYLEANSIMVSQKYADLSEQGGFEIDSSHITP